MNSQWIKNLNVSETEPINSLKENKWEKLHDHGFFNVTLKALATKSKNRPIGLH